MLEIARYCAGEFKELAESNLGRQNSSRLVKW